MHKIESSFYFRLTCSSHWCKTFHHYCFQLKCSSFASMVQHSILPWNLQQFNHLASKQYQILHSYKSMLQVKHKSNGGLSMYLGNGVLLRGWCLECKRYFVRDILMGDYLQMSSMFPMPSSFIHNIGFIKNRGIQVISYRL